MPARPQWLLAIPDAIRQLEALDRELLTRRDIEQLFGVSRARAAQLMHTFGADLTGYARTLPRTAAAAAAADVPVEGTEFRGEQAAARASDDRAAEGAADRHSGDGSGGSARAGVCRAYLRAWWSSATGSKCATRARRRPW